MENPLNALSDALAQAVAYAAPSAAGVHARPRLGSSGVVWAPGVLVTADHTISREEDVAITFGDGRARTAELVGRDPGSDIAVLRFDASGSPAPLPVSKSVPAAGSLVLAIGRATDGGTAATMGIISVSGGPWTTWRGGKLDTLLRLDMRLYPTCSGSAVIGIDGSLIGIATSGLTRTLPAAVPASTVDRTVRELLETGHVRRGYLGVGVQPVNLPQQLVSAHHLSSNRGLIVLTTEPDSPAERAGILVGDVLVKLNGTAVGDLGDLQSALAGIDPGTPAEAHILRGGVPVAFKVEIGQRPPRG